MRELLTRSHIEQLWTAKKHNISKGDTDQSFHKDCLVVRPIFQTFIECHWHRSYISIHCNFRMFLKINIPHRARKKLQSCIRRQFLGTILCFLVQCPYRADLGERGRWHWNQMRGQEAPLLCSPLWWKYPLCNAMHLTAVSSYVWPVREISCSVSDACLQSASATIIYLSMPHSTPISSIRHQQMCFIASKQEFWSFTSSQNVECEIRFSEIHNAVWQWHWKSVHCHSRRGNN